MSDLDISEHVWYIWNMNVHLTDEQRKFVRERVSSGQYASASEVLRAGLRMLVEDEQWRAEVREKIARGMAQAKAGKLVDGDAFFDELEASLKPDSH